MQAKNRRVPPRKRGRIAAQANGQPQRRRATKAMPTGVRREDGELWVEGDCEEADASSPGQSIDGIRYELHELNRGLCTVSYEARADGRPIRGKEGGKLVVIRHLGASADSRYVILGVGLPRIERDTKPELFTALAKVIHG